jgi:hypothetical protein
MSIYTNMKIFKHSGLLTANPDINPDEILSKYKKIKTVVEHRLTIESNEDFYDTLESLRYHMVDDIPFAVYDWLVQHPETELSNYKDIACKDFEIILDIINTYNEAYDENGKSKLFSHDFNIKRKIVDNYDVIRSYRFGDTIMSLSLTKFLVEKLHIRFLDEILENFIEKSNQTKNIETFKYLFDIGYELYGMHYYEDEYYSTEWNVCATALGCGNTNYLKFALDHGCPVSNIADAYRTDNVDMLIFLEQYGYDLKRFYEKSRRKYGWRGDTFLWQHQINSLSRNHSIKCIKYLFEKHYISIYDITIQLKKEQSEWESLANGDGNKYADYITKIKEIIEAVKQIR